MRRFTFPLSLTVCSLAVSIAASADDQVSLADAGPSLAAGAAALDVPPVLPPNDAVALGPQTANLDTPQLTAPQALQQVLAQPTTPAQPQQLITPTQPGVPLQPGVPAQQLVIDPTQPNQLAYFSPRLGARFLIEQTSLPQFGMFWGARIVSEPAVNSPLRQLGLSEGDLLTRLDGLPVVSTLELERHILETGVRFIRAGEQHVCQDTMFVHPGMYFADPYAPVCPHTPGCGSLVLRP